MPSEELTLVGLERRTNRRFRLSLQLRYLFPNLSGEERQGGEGQVLDISSGGIFFQPGGILPVGARAELVVMWPYLLNGDCPLQLRVQGRVLRSDSQGTALRISRYEFRTAPKSPASRVATNGSVRIEPAGLRLARWR